jgi:acetylglutamate kinase
MLYGAEVTVCSQINTKHINTVWQNVKLLIVKPVGASRNQQALKG